jgi:hypothetical protein
MCGEELKRPWPSPYARVRDHDLENERERRRRSAGVSNEIRTRDPLVRGPNQIPETRFFFNHLRLRRPSHLLGIERH